eukprot:TRINITY_DN4331_c0_g1_i4.p3 TRINITY_DN4331_c0_g1~~TRINITY_DN4331_c0_g1_i4.p3  ORF type:complete len:62 (-),score=9.35 TRINITY_DN4331_c0_g1_i4:62-247(-)
MQDHHLLPEWPCTTQSKFVKKSSKNDGMPGDKEFKRMPHKLVEEFKADEVDDREDWKRTVL